MKVIGLMSGTSADGIDAALLEVGPGKALPELRLLPFAVFPFPAGLRQRTLPWSDWLPRAREVVGLWFHKRAVPLPWQGRSEAGRSRP